MTGDKVSSDEFDPSDYDDAKELAELADELFDEDAQDFADERFLDLCNLDEEEMDVIEEYFFED